MKRRLPIILTFLMILPTAGCGKVNKTVRTTNKIDKSSWDTLSTMQITFPCNISGFLNKDMGITVGYSGEIHFTASGGKEWGTGVNSSMCLFGLDILNDKTALACGNGSFVIKTADGGKNWIKVSGFGESEPNQPRHLSFADEKIGWIATPTKFTLGNNSIMLGSTTDGCKTWVGINLPNDVNSIVAIFLRTPNDGYVLDASGNLYITSDAGKSFKKQVLSINDADLSVKDTPVVAFTFTDEKNVILAYNSNKTGTVQIIRSSDGGTTWVKDSIPDIKAGSLYLTRDGKFLTATLADGSIKVLEHK